ncbi:spindle and kinetochore-associated protein 2 isoform X1 [Gambusia affinis]|nr:spindle and kinetochore-associated protein 2 isoform X1 [Gambusia affinis]
MVLFKIVSFCSLVFSEFPLSFGFQQAFLIWINLKKNLTLWGGSCRTREIFENVNFLICIVLDLVMHKPTKRMIIQFLKSEADLEYIERRLKLDFINGASESVSFAKENVTGILENLKSIKAKHSLLRCQVSQITDAQKGSMELIKSRLGAAMELIKHCQQASHLEVESLAESEQESAIFLDSTISSITVELKS